MARIGAVFTVSQSRAVQHAGMDISTPPAPDPDFAARLRARVPADVAASFTPDQLAAMQRAFGTRYAMEHAVDVRRTVTLPWGRFYLVLLFGRDRRRDDRSGDRRGWNRLAQGLLTRNRLTRDRCAMALCGWLALAGAALSAAIALFAA